MAAIPFTPATGQRLPARTPDADAGRGDRGAAARACAQVADDERGSSVHLLFCTEAEKAALGRAAATCRACRMQFHWQNRADRPFESFDDYLSTFRSRNRKQVRKERQRAAAHGLTFRTATGAELDDARLGGAAARSTSPTSRATAASTTCSERFFEVARATLAHRLVATLAYRGSKPVAGTMNFETGPPPLRPLLGLPRPTTRCCTSSTATTG